MQAALANLRGGEASVLVAAKMDRVSRSLLDFIGLLATAQTEGWTLLALDSPVDGSTPMGEAMLSIQATFAQLERRMISDRTKARLAAKRAAGVRLGRPRLVSDEVAALAVELRAQGLGPVAIARALGAPGMPRPRAARGITRQCASCSRARLRRARVAGFLYQSTVRPAASSLDRQSPCLYGSVGEPGVAAGRLNLRRRTASEKTKGALCSAPFGGQPSEPFTMRVRVPSYALIGAS
jgi:hypothetical protein